MFARRPSSRPSSKGAQWFSRRKDRFPDFDSQLVLPSVTTSTQTQRGPQKRNWFEALWQTKKNPKAVLDDPAAHPLLDSELLELLHVPVTRTAIESHKDVMLHKYLVEAEEKPHDVSFYFQWSIWLRDERNLSVKDTVWRQNQLGHTLANAMAANHSNVYVLRALVKPTLRCHKIVFKVSPEYSQLFFSTLAIVVPTGMLDPTEQVPSTYLSNSFRTVQTNTQFHSLGFLWEAPPAATLL